ncbi:ABC transporter ATP-binding protein [Parafrankia colletiae]|uniref:ABC transporter ATP-binding protein n=1 Tax=Parafrankia colletiae TaxID=573497 RepID=A0A1S1QK06_9ACTN|nr:ABC transporter ATP-binding protein [Parafrankia colletiae]MCK9899948.1 ABC transporter ATP-binding protein [Frankia sp. Cpl3]OHV34300.1 ABC transporter ATP-binding protein [Parafrankia colletiae]
MTQTTQTTQATQAGLCLEDLAVGYRRRALRPSSLRGRPGRSVRSGRAVLAGLSAAAPRGQLTVLLGPNGIGKSTLLRTLAGLQPPLAGRVRLDGADLGQLSGAERARLVGVVLTDRVQIGLLTAAELVGLGRHPHTGPTGRLTDADHAIVRWALDAVHARHLAGRPVDELSDGERQRVMMARALAQEPSMILLDEPTAFLDAPSRVTVTALLRRLARERNLAVIVSTHDLELSLRVADQVWLVDRTGALHTGHPDEVVGSGAVNTSFDGDDLRFDPATRTFELRGPL